MYRLSTIRNADLIVVVDKGELVEQGTHNELVGFGGIYADLVKKQEINKAEDKNVHKIGIIEEPSTTDDDVSDKEMNTLTEDTFKNMMSDSTNEKFSIAIDNGKEKLQLTRNEDKEASYTLSSISLRIVNGMRKEWLFMFFGYICVILSGAPYPIFAFLFSKATVTIAEQTQSPSPLEGSNLYAFAFAMMGVGCLFVYFIKVAALEIAGETYTRRLRYDLFNAYMKQEISFFDQKGNTTGAIISKLANDTKNVNEMLTQAWPELIRIVVTGVVGMLYTLFFIKNNTNNQSKKINHHHCNHDYLLICKFLFHVLGVVIAFIFSWQLTLVVLALTPLLMFSVYFEVYAENQFSTVMQKSYAESSELAISAIKGIRTVASLNQQKYFEAEFRQATERPHRLNRKRAILSSAGYALTQCCVPLSECISFYAGMHFIANQWINFEQMLTSLMMILITAMGIGQSLTFTKTVAKARISAQAIFKIIDRQPLVDPDLEGAEPMTINGDIHFENISFRYPARPDIPIFSGAFNLHGKKNTSIALVGPSGCGKSTCLSMLERFYDPLGGSVRVDHTDVGQFSLFNLRSHMALVSQEPTLFDISIGENIRYGAENQENVSQEKIEEACKSANIHEFIASLPQGYDTKVGDKGSQLSGGQKQR